MKNKKMGFVAVLVMLVAVTLYSVGGTYAKYISAFDASDEARVAKWNVGTLTKDGDELDFNQEFSLFKNSYTYDEDGLVAWTIDENGNQCDADTCDNIVAPGSHGRFTFKLAGETETAFKVTVKLDDEDLGIDSYNNIVLGSGDTKYDPIRFTVDGGFTWVTFDGLEAALQEAINYALYNGGDSMSNLGGQDNVFNPGKFTTGEISIYWSWAFDTENEDISIANPNAAKDYDYDPSFRTDDAKDTELGNAIANGEIDSDIKLNLNITFEQVQGA